MSRCGAFSPSDCLPVRRIVPNNVDPVWGTVPKWICPYLRHCLPLSYRKTLQSINCTIPAVHAVYFEWSLLPSLFTYSHIYLSLEAIPWHMMHCVRRFMHSGIRLLCRRDPQLLRASINIIKSSIPDVQIPSTPVPDYVWQRVDQWPEKVAIVSIHRAYKELRLTSVSRRLA
jgi:hypothetical protein